MAKVIKMAAARFFRIIRLQCRIFWKKGAGPEESGSEESGPGGLHSVQKRENGKRDHKHRDITCRFPSGGSAKTVPPN
jgi:hypothetical protein